LQKPLFYDLLIGISIIFLSINYLETRAGVSLVGMYLIGLFISKAIPSRIHQNNIPKNTGGAIGAALVAFGLFFIVALGFTLFFQGTAFLQGNFSIGEQIQSVMRHGFAATGLPETTPIFAGSLLLTLYTFILVVPYTETVFLVRSWEALTSLFGISLERMSLQLGAVYGALGIVFVWLHSNVKGVEDNVALLMTFIFAIFTFELVRKRNVIFSKVVQSGREMESAIWLHIINNATFILRQLNKLKLI